MCWSVVKGVKVDCRRSAGGWRNHGGGGNNASGTGGTGGGGGRWLFALSGTTPLVPVAAAVLGTAIPTRWGTFIRRGRWAHHGGAANGAVAAAETTQPRGSRHRRESQRCRNWWYPAFGEMAAVSRCRWNEHGKWRDRQWGLVVRTPPTVALKGGGGGGGGGYNGGGGGGGNATGGTGSARGGSSHIDPAFGTGTFATASAPAAYWSPSPRSGDPTPGSFKNCVTPPQSTAYRCSASNS